MNIDVVRSIGLAGGGNADNDGMIAKLISIPETE